MPPYEINGKQVLMVDAGGNPINIQGYMLTKEQAALQGQVYNPTIGFETIRNINGDTMQVSLQPVLWRIQPARFGGMESQLRQRTARRVVGQE